MPLLWLRDSQYRILLYGANKTPAFFILACSLLSHLSQARGKKWEVNTEMRYELKSGVLPYGEWRDQNCVMCGWNVDPYEDRYIAYCHECKGEKCQGTDKVYHICCMLAWRKEFRHETGRDLGDFHNDLCSHKHQRYAEDVAGEPKPRGQREIWEDDERHRQHRTSFDDVHKYK